MYFRGIHSQFSLDDFSIPISNEIQCDVLAERKTEGKSKTKYIRVRTYRLGMSVFKYEKVRLGENKIGGPLCSGVRRVRGGRICRGNQEIRGKRAEGRNRGRFAHAARAASTKGWNRLEAIHSLAHPVFFPCI